MIFDVIQMKPAGDLQVGSSMILKVLRSFWLSLFVIFVPVVLAQTSLYQAEVSAEQTQQQWQRAALIQVMQRLTGDLNIMQRPELRSELNNAAAYVKQFEAFRSEQGNQIRVLLDAQRIQNRLQQLQIPIWGGQRPDMLFWIVEQQAFSRQFIRQPEDPRLSAFINAMTAESLAVNLPLYDLDDLMAVSELDVWGGFWEPILLASSRYRVNEVVLLLLEPLDSAQWQLTAIRRQADQLRRDELVAEEPEAVFAAYAALLKQQIVEQFALVLDPTNQHAISLRISGVANLADIVNLERRLAEILGVVEVRILSQQPAYTDFHLRLQIKPEQLISLLAVEPSLQRINIFPAEFAPDQLFDVTADEQTAPLAQFQYIRR